MDIEAFDSSKFDDPVASKTGWSPIKKGGSSFQVRKLVRKHTGRVEFQATTSAKFFALVFMVIGGACIILALSIFVNEAMPGLNS